MKRYASIVGKGFGLTKNHNIKVKSLAILPTVLSMRHQRCKTVQRAAQYVYIAKCLRWVFKKKKEKMFKINVFLSHMVSTEKGDYYEC